MEFTESWHECNETVWREIILPLLPQGPRKWLELGCFEGKSAAWTLEHAIREGDELVCVDIWKRKDVEERFNSNVASRVTKFKEPHESFLLRQIREGRKYDVIYVDGDHDAPAVLSDSVLGWKILRANGILIFDDYHWRGGWMNPGAVDPCHAIDGFLNTHSTRLKILHRGYQVIVQKSR